PWRRPMQFPTWRSRLPEAHFACSTETLRHSAGDLNPKNLAPASTVTGGPESFRPGGLPLWAIPSRIARGSRLLAARGTGCERDVVDYRACQGSTSATPVDSTSRAL